MRKPMLSMGLTIGALALTASGASADATPYGRWARGDGIAKVVIVACGDALCAINTWIKPGVTEEKVGERLVMNVKQRDSSRWIGTAFDPKRDLTFDITVEVSPSQMKTNGCVVGGLLCKNIEWTRIAGK